MRKAQAATEYLIVLAVVIIIALIVIGVMGGIPGIGAGARGRASAAYWGTADVAITAYSVSDTTPADTVALTLKNNMRNAIRISAVTVGTSLDLVATDITLAPGGSSTVSGTIVPTCTAGQAFSYDVSMVYTDIATGAGYTFTGDGTQLEGTCAT